MKTKWVKQRGIAMIDFEAVKKQSTEEYFKGNQFSIDAFNKKYTLYEGETYVQAVKRVCDYIASAEDSPEKQAYWSARWFDEIYNDWWHPAGSIMQGAASGKKISLANCSTVSLGTGSNDEEWDNLESIIKNAGYTIAKMAAYRQGLGIDVSRLRPVGTKVLNSSNESQGVVHWIKFFDSLGYFVGQKGRIPAFLISLNVKNPDVIDFIKSKSDKKQIQNANISVQCTNGFYECVLADEDWEMLFEIPEVKKGQKVYIDVHSTDKDCQYDEKNKKWYYIARKNRPYEKITKTTKAREILELIAKGMCQYAEPGIQNIDIARKYSNSDYVYDPNDEYDSRIISSNAPLLGTTRIPTKYGILPIKELYEKQNNEQIELITDSLTTLPDWCVDWKASKNLRINYFPTKTFPVLAKIKKFENQKIWKITLSNQKEIFCNEEHSWFINGKMTKTKNITVGSKIFCPNGGIVDAYDIPSDFNSASFKEGELIGYIVGDGWIGKESNIHNEMIGIVYDDDCQYFSDLFRSKYLEITGKELKLERDRGKIKEVRTESVKFVSWFKSFGFKNDKYHAPEKCFRDIDFCRGFLRGLYQADGSVYTNKKQGYINLTTVSKSLALDVECLLSNWFGIFANLRESKSKGVIYGKNKEKISNAKNRFDLRFGRYDFIEKFIRNIGLIGKKGIKLNKALHVQRNIRNFLTISSVDETNEFADMYCAVVNGIHSFVANGYMSSNCSEQYLSRDSECILSSINAGKFSTNPDEYEKELDTIGHSVNRFLDNVNEMELRDGTYSTPFQRMAIEKLRRTGAGYTNLAAWLFKKNLEYASNDGNNAIEHFTERYNYYLYKSSIELGKEKGNFGLFNRAKFEKSPFVKRMMKLGLEFETMRTVTCTSLAPTGSLSLMFQDSIFSYGIEPAFGIYFWKRTRISGKYEYYFCVPSVVKEYFAKNGFIIPMKGDAIKDTWDGKHGTPIAKFIDEKAKELDIKFKRATEVNALDKLDLMAKVMKWIDSSISVTYMLPEGSDWKDVYNFILEANKREVKSIAAFPDRKMYGIVSFMPFKDLAVKLEQENIKISPENFCDDEIKELEKICNKQIADIGKIQKTHAPKRPKYLQCDVHHIKISKKLDKVRTFDYLVFVGLMSGEPYEVFCAENGTLDKKYKTGRIFKKSKGNYCVELEDETIIQDITKDCTETEDALTRLVSCSLRHGADIQFVVQQLEKSKGDLIAFSKAMSRVLKRYIQDGAKENGVRCPQCNSENIIRQDGCATCACGWSKCS
jgi:ribonucleoside-diphosphate reductase alpha chain